MQNRGLREQSITARQLRSTIKSIVAQLDSWEANQKLLASRRTQANKQAGGARARRQAALSRAQKSEGTQDLQDPPCVGCGSTVHLSEEGDTFLPHDKTVTHRDRLTDNPADKIHRSILHRLYSKSCELYLCHYPSAHSSRDSTASEISEVSVAYPEATAGFDYQAIAINKASTDLWNLLPLDSTEADNDREKRNGIICRLYYSKAFPLDFLEFHKRVVEAFENLIE